jgi:dynein heavy chain
MQVTPLLDTIIEAFLEFKVPAKWGFAYPSLKPLAAWTRDLIARTDQLEGWWTAKMPTVYWLPGLTYPTGFLTALLQTTARKNALAIDSLVWDFPIVNSKPEDVRQPPKEGALASGMFLEGARWDPKNASTGGGGVGASGGKGGKDVDTGCLTQPLPMELYAPMPIIHFKPIQTSSKKKVGKGVYMCPLYMYPIRTGSRERPSYVATIELKSGNATPEFWTKRGTAIILSLAF